MTPRFEYCPFCAEGILWPHGGLQSGMWRCGKCGRIHVPGSGPPAEIDERQANMAAPAWWGPPPPPDRAAWPDRTLERWKGSSDQAGQEWCELARAELAIWRREYERWRADPANHRPACCGAEALLFGLSAANPPDGTGVGRLGPDELRRQLEAADVRLREKATATRWLERYAGLLVAEARRRRGAA